MSKQYAIPQLGYVSPEIWEKETGTIIATIRVPNDRLAHEIVRAVNRDHAFEAMREALEMAHEALGAHKGYHQGTTATKIRAALAMAEKGAGE